MALIKAPLAAGLIALTLAGCNPKTPEETAVHPMLAGVWRPASGKDDCSGGTLRFDRKGLIQSTRGREINMLEVKSMEIQGSSIEIEFAPSARMMLEAESVAKVEGLAHTTITITLMVSGNSISLRDIQIRDAKKGLQAPTGGKRASIQKMFELRRCPATTAA